MTRDAVFDSIGVGYAERRRPDPRIAAHIADALGDARTVLNVGAGAGSYELPDREWIAIDPSDVMIRQRPAGAAPVVRGVAEALPFVTDAFDAAIAVLSLQHWSDPEGGLGELTRVARRQVILTWDVEYYASNFWFVRDYVPEMSEWERTVATLDTACEVLHPIRVVPVPVPHDCTDGFGGAYWRRPEAYLDPEVRASISGLALMTDGIAARAVERLRADLKSGEWHERNAELRDLEEFDVGYRLVISERR
jgi:SAM-dependent methyltransferase